MTTSDNPGDEAGIEALTIGVLGGTGPLGLGLATRFAKAGQRVLVGSRSAERAAQTVESLPGDVAGVDNATCARDADLVIVAVPFEGHRELLASLRSELDGKIVVDCVNPLGFDKQGSFALPVDEGSACQQAQALLPGSRVVGAFHHLSAPLLLDLQLEAIQTDVLVVGDDRGATDLVQALAGRINGIRGIYGGRLRNAHQVEALTANLISVNRRYKSHAGLRVTDV